MKKNTTFYLVRHGETDWNKKRLVQGHTDIPLNETGEEQAKTAAKKFKSVKFDRAFSSDLLRAKRTAEIIALEHKLAVQTTKLLRERHNGTFEGKPSPLLLEQKKLLVELTEEKRKQHRFSETGESTEEVISRIITFLRETAIAYPGEIILIATHGGTLYELLVHLGSLTFEESLRTHITNAGYIVLETDGVDFFVKETSGITPR